MLIGWAEVPTSGPTEAGEAESPGEHLKAAFPRGVETPGSNPLNVPCSEADRVAGLPHTVTQLVHSALHNSPTGLGRKLTAIQLHESTSFLKEIYPQKVAVKAILKNVYLHEGHGKIPLGERICPCQRSPSRSFIRAYE